MMWLLDVVDTLQHIKPCPMLAIRKVLGVFFCKRNPGHQARDAAVLLLILALFCIGMAITAFWGVEMWLNRQSGHRFGHLVSYSIMFY